MCVSECPMANNVTKCHATSNHPDATNCPTADYDTKLYLNRYCIPTNSSLVSYVTSYLGNARLGNYIGDLATCWWMFLVMLGISTVIALIYLFLLRCVAKPLIYISFVLILLILIASGAYVFA